jgi:hypothetical protein
MKVNKITDKIMPYALVLLIIVIILEFAVHIENHTVHLIIQIADYVIISFFVVDLISIYFLSPNLKYFFKNSWLDILAVMPFGLIFRVGRSVIRIGQATERIALGQGVLHGILKSEKLVVFLARFEKLSKFFRFISKGIKKIKNSSFFSKLHDHFYYTKSQYELFWKGKFHKFTRVKSKKTKL